MNIKEWLAQNNYEDVLKKICAVEKSWRMKGSGTHRNWADVLAGHKDGSPRTLEGIRFPVLLAARKRKGWTAINGCICRNPEETMPSIKPQIRWKKCKTHVRNKEE